LKDLRALGVEVRLNTPVTSVSPDAVHLGEETIASRTIFWAAGNRGSSLSKTFPEQMDKGGHLRVNQDLSLPGHPRFSSSVTGGDQQPRWQAGSSRRATGDADGPAGRAECCGAPRRKTGTPFRYQTHGDLAVIGRYRPWPSFRG
jgi:NADH dehydrogenase